MYPNPITLNDGTVAVAFDYRGPTGPDSSRYESAPVSGLDMGSASVLNIKHAKSNVNTVHETRRSVMRIDIPVVDASGNRDKITAYVVSSIPLKIATDGFCEAALIQVKNFLSTSGWITKFTNGEI